MAAPELPDNHELQPGSLSIIRPAGSGAGTFETFIKIAADGSVTAFIPDPDLAQADVNRISGASGIVADDKGTIYAADVGPHRLRKYIKVK